MLLVYEHHWFPDDGYQAPHYVCFDCIDSGVWIGKESLKEYTGYSIDQLIQLIRKAETPKLPESQTGIPAGATLPTVASCPSDI